MWNQVSLQLDLNKTLHHHRPVLDRCDIPVLQNHVSKENSSIVIGLFVCLFNFKQNFTKSTKLISMKPFHEEFNHFDDNKF